MDSTKVSSISMFVLILIGVLLFILAMTDSYDPILYGSYLYFGIGIALTLGGAAYGILTNPSGIKEMVIGLVGMVVVFGVSYVLSDGSDFVDYQNVGLTEGMSKFSGMLLYAIYILFGATIATVAGSWVYGLTR